MSISFWRFVVQEKKRDLNARKITPHELNLVDNRSLTIKQVNQKFKVDGNYYEKSIWDNENDNTKKHSS